MMSDTPLVSEMLSTPTSLLDLDALRQLWKERRWGDPAWKIFHQGYFERMYGDYADFVDLPQAIREALSQTVDYFPLRPLDTVIADDQTTKMLFETHDGLKLESVLMRYGGFDGKPERFSVCVSSQVGCPARCAFCATGTMKWSRNLRSDEILAQVIHFNRQLAPQGKRVQNIVFMGMGEPLLNGDEVFTAIRHLLDQRKFSLGQRQITLSTVGIVPGIERMLAEQLKICLAVSLHGPNDEVRTRIVPINKAYPITELMAVIDRWTSFSGKPVFYEYVMLKGINDQPEHAAELAELFQNRPAILNLIPYNPGPGQFELAPTEREQIFAFARIVRAGGIKTLVRHTFGQDIAAACGQLVTSKK